ncbi:hypothetical protein PS15p_206883 [Mucor circinelloides]
MDAHSADSTQIIASILAGIMRELRCDICLSTLNEATTTFCGHTFCRGCIIAAIDEEGKCPTCNREANMDQLNPAEPYQGAVQHFMQIKQEFERANGIDLSTVEIMNLPEDRNMEMSPEAPDLDHGPPSTEQPKYRILQMTENPIKHISIPDARLEQKVTADVTHAVFDTVGKSDLVKNTQKYRMAIACGYHIVSETWLKISIEKGSIQSPERFHVYGDETYGRTGAPKKAWESRDKKKGHLLRHLKVGLIDDVKGEYRKYLVAARATIGDFDDLIVCKLDQDIEALRNKYPGKNLISCKWIEASICRYELDDKSKYIL